MTALRFSRTSDLAVEVDVVLATLTLNGVNAELWPLVRITAPAVFAQRPLQEWPERQHLFKSWILLLDVLPIDRHTFYLHAVMPGKGFVETSSSTLNALWQHERTIIPLATGCRVTDIVEYRCRLPLLGYLLKPLYQLVFCCSRTGPVPDFRCRSGGSVISVPDCILGIMIPGHRQSA